MVFRVERGAGFGVGGWEGDQHSRRSSRRRNSRSSGSSRAVGALRQQQQQRMAHWLVGCNDTSEHPHNSRLCWRNSSTTSSSTVGHQQQHLGPPAAQAQAAETDNLKESAHAPPPPHTPLQYGFPTKQCQHPLPHPVFVPVPFANSLPCYVLCVGQHRPDCCHCCCCCCCCAPPPCVPC